MLSKSRHQMIMGQILRDFYSDTSIASVLGFKGGTCAYFFYNLPRFSVDLDFDLLSEKDQDKQLLFEKIKNILQKYGQIKDEFQKHFTLFFLVSYGEKEHNIKIEINLRQLMPKLKDQYELKEYLGIAMLVAKQDYMFAAKLSALTERKKTAMRDIFDSWFFAKNNWDINLEFIQIRSGKNIPDYLQTCIELIEKVKDNQILQGLGELLNHETKVWVKNSLRKETIFYLKNYQSAFK